MPDIIHLLPDAIANQIAAGEVIQRPASVVKELMENAIDAGASSVQLIIKDAGKALIQVVDNGCGMSPTDARLSFERHATSKISSADDLFCIRTMGFRGEALASMAAIAQVELRTRKAEDDTGTLILVEGSEVKRQEVCATAPGTSFSVKNLFFNTPARRNFLKSNTVETRHIIEEFQRVALAYPDVEFTLHHNSMEVFHLHSGNLRRRIVSVFGNIYNERLVPVEEHTDVLGIRGFIGKPEAARKTRGEQYFFVNNRYIRSPYLHHAIQQAYRDLVPDQSHPMYVIFFDIDPARIDVNVHPTKQEIKFEDERLVYAYLMSAVKRALGKYSITPTIDFDVERSFEGFGKGPVPADLKQPGGKEVFTLTAGQGMGAAAKPHGNTWLDLLQTESPAGTITIASRMPPEPGVATGSRQLLDTESDTRPYQLHQSYIFTTIKDGMVIIDQQAAHERILYERYRRALAGTRHMSQKTLFPQTIRLATADAEVLRQLLPEVNALGFDIQEFGRHDFVVHGLPPEMEGQGEQEAIEGLLEQYKLHGHDIDDGKRDKVARAMAVQMAIKQGRALDEKEMRSLIDELFACEDFYQAPNGNLTFVRYTLQELERLFQKPGT